MHPRIALTEFTGKMEGQLKVMFLTFAQSWRSEYAYLALRGLGFFLNSYTSWLTALNTPPTNTGYQAIDRFLRTEIAIISLNAFREIIAISVRKNLSIAWYPVLVGGVFNAVNQDVYEFRKNPNPLKAKYSNSDLQLWAQS